MTAQPLTLRPSLPQPGIAAGRLRFASSLIAGMVDVISFVLLQGLFTAHITGNLVVLAADLALHQPLKLASVLSIPVFIAVTATLALIVGVAPRPPRSWAISFLTVQFVLLAAAFVLAVTTTNIIAVALLAVAAMASQNSILHLTLRSAPSTAVMTGNTVSATIALVGLALHRGSDQPDDADAAAWRHLWPLLLGFILGCLVGAGAAGALDSWAWLLPTVLTGALALSVTFFDLVEPSAA